MKGLVRRAWIPLALVVVFAVSALVAVRLHKLFGTVRLVSREGEVGQDRRS
jgi:MmpS family membrane protein